MNFKQLLLILTLTLIPTAHAMRFKGTFTRASKQTSPAAFTAYNKNQGIYAKKLFTGSHSSYLPFMLGTSIGLMQMAWAQEEEKQEKENAQEETPFSIQGLDLKNPQAIIEAFQKANEADKQLLAQKVAHTISWYSAEAALYTIEDIGNFLKYTTKKSHRTLITAFSRNITRFTPKDIMLILKSDSQDETHRYIAQALQENYAAFTSYFFCGFKLASKKEWRREYVAILKALKPEYQRKVLEPILENIEHYNVFDLLYYADNQYKQDILKALTQAPSINLNNYEARYIHHLLELTKPLNQTIVAQAIADNIDHYNGWHFHGMFKLCTQESKKIILKAIAERLDKNIKKYDPITLSIVLEMAQELPQETSSINIIKIRDAHLTAPEPIMVAPKKD